jgi:O-antigen ligase
MNALFAPRCARLALLLLLNLFLLALLAGFVWFDNAANRGITFQPAPQPIPGARGPVLGVNLFNMHLEPDPAAVRRSFELARDLGAQYARMQVPWDDIEIHARGDFTDRRNVAAVGVVDAWAKYDRIVAEANAADVQLIMRLERPPDWARPNFIAHPAFQEGILEDGNSTGPPDDLADYANFVRAVVERYDGDGIDDAPNRSIVRHFQIWNEPNLKNEWNWQTPRPEDFVELLRVGATAARAASPEVVILFPGLAPTDGLDRRAPMTELEYLDRVYKAGGAAYFDVMAAQSYGLGQPPSEHRYVFLRNRGNWNWRQPIDTRNDVSRVVLLREVMEQNGDAATPVWVTEFGWNAAPDTIPPERRLTWGEPVSEEVKGAYLVGQIERARNEWPWIGVMNVWMLRYGGYAMPDPADPTPYFALVSRDDWQPLPSFTTLQRFMDQPAVAGVGAFTLEHPAVERLPDGLRIRFAGTRITLVGGLEGDIQPTLNGQPVSLLRDGLEGRQALSTARLPDGEHLLEVRGAPLPTWFIVERARPWAAFWDYGPLLVLFALAVSGAATTHTLFPLLDDLRGRWATHVTPRVRASVVLALMTLALIVAYRLSPGLPITLLGLLAFGGLALWRPDLALLYVPLTVPLYFMPKAIFDERFGIRPEGLYLPLHELVLIIVLGATAVRWGMAQAARRSSRFSVLGSRFSVLGSRFWAIGLFALAGLWGVLIAGERGPALREFRWMILGPLLFYALIVFWQAQPDRATVLGRLLPAFLLSGALVGLIGILQFLGLNLVPLIGQKVGFSDDSIFVEGVRRVSSVYGHPNNLGLFMGRVWPIAAALAFGAWLTRGQEARENGEPAHDQPQTSDLKYQPSALSPQPASRLLLPVAALLSLGGLVVSFSRGAYLGALAAALVIGVFLAPPGFWRTRRVRLALAAAGALAVVAVIALVALDIDRFNPFGASSDVRLKTWASALAMLRDHPLGVGLDQFGRLYPQYIDPSLAGTNEINTAHPHNLILDIALRMGPLGLLAFGWLLAAFFRHTIPASRLGATQTPRPAQQTPRPAQQTPRPAQQTPRRGVSSFLAVGLAAAMVAALVHGAVDAFYFWPDLAFAFWLFIAFAARFTTPQDQGTLATDRPAA